MNQNQDPKKLEEEGARLYRSSQYQEAAEIFQQASEEYLLAGDHLRSAEMKNNRCVALLQNKQPEQALEAVRDTELLFAEAGDLEKQAVALSNQGTALQALKKRQEARDKFQEAGILFLELEKPDMYLQVMQSISSLELREGNPLGAVEAMRSGLARVSRPTFRQRILKTLLKIPGKLVGR